MKKALGSLALVGMLISSVSGSAFAENVSDATYNELQSQSPITILAEAKYPGAGTYYEPTSTTRAKEVDFTMEVQNTGAGTQSITRTVSIEQFGQVSVGAETEFNIMAQKVKASGSFTGGKRTIKTTAITWTVPAKSVYTLRAGSVTITTNGYIEKANSAGVVTNRYYNSGHWTTADFSDSIFVRKL